VVIRYAASFVLHKENSIVEKEKSNYAKTSEVHNIGQVTLSVPIVPVPKYVN